jgi:hypothetical protein
VNIVKRLSRLLIVILGTAGLALLASPNAEAIPSFARQTGLPCSTCHTIPPELTPFGRTFKLNGYTLTGLPQVTAKPSSQESGLSIARYFPLSGFVQLSLAGTNKTQPGTQNWNYEFPQSASLFLAGAMASHAGGFIQVTYDAQGDHFSWDNTDIRYANRTHLGGKQLIYGITFDNNPTVEDLWNSTPAWGFPWIGPDQTPSPTAATLLDGTLAQDVAGLGAYAMWNNHLYLAATAYRSEHIGSSQPNDGSSAAINLQGAAPYWRLAWQQTMGNNYLEVGTYGLHVASTPGTISGLEDRYTDVAADLQYERVLPTLHNNLISLHANYIHETQDLNATFDAEGSDFVHHVLNTVKADVTYHFGNKYGATFGAFNTWGTPDPTLYPSSGDPTVLSGSANGSPDSDGYILQFAYWPVQNIDITAQYTGYWKFNGARINYDVNRNASNNNAAYFTVWFVF